jgi:SPP1 family phage portal protein
MNKNKIFYVPVGSEPTKELIEEAIKFNEGLVSHYNELEDYYLGEHPILSRKRINTTINNKVVVNHCHYITDTNVGYLLGNPVKYSVRDGVKYEKIEDEYRKQTLSDLDHEIAKDLSIYGRQYEYIYVAGEGKEKSVRSVEVNVRNCIIAYDDSFEHNKVFAVLYRKEGKDFEDVIVLTEEAEISFLVGNVLERGEEFPHGLGMVPVVEYRNNDEYMGDYEQVIPLVNAYNTLQSDRINDKEQLVNAIMIIKGMDLTEEQREDLKVTRTLANVPLNAEIEMLVKNLDETQLDILRKNISDDIHKISKTPNLSDENFVGNASGVAIRYKLLAFEQNIKNKERSFEKGLIERFVIYNRYLNKMKNMALINGYDVDVIFTRNLPQNDFETSQMINNLWNIGLPVRLLLDQLSFVPNAEEAIKEAERELKKAVKKETPNYGTKKPNEDIE